MHSRPTPGDRFELVLTNPPFGRKSSMTAVNAEGESESEQLVIVRDDFWASTSNKQLNFVQHEHLRDFIEYKPESRRDRVDSRRLKRFGYDELIQRDKVSLDLVWLRDDSLEDMDNLPRRR